MSDSRSQDPRHQFAMQQTAMLHAAFSLLRDLEPDKTETLLKEVVNNCEKAGYGSDLPNAILKGIYPQNR